MTWAKELHGAAVYVEHRYFGDSKPFGASNPTEQLEQFQYLTLDNVLENAVSLTKSLQATLTGGRDSKVIVAGGSYPGWLVTMNRQNRPDTFWGAVASAAGMEGWYSEQDNTWHTYGNAWVSNLYQRESFEAWVKIKNAYTTLIAQIASGNISTLQTDFGLCHPPDNETVTYLPQVPSFVHQLGAQYNLPYVGTNNPIASPFETVINITLSESDPIQLLIALYGRTYRIQH